jgi:hypothetical protein
MERHFFSAAIAACIVCAIGCSAKVTEDGDDGSNQGALTKGGTSTADGKAGEPGKGEPGKGEPKPDPGCTHPPKPGGCFIVDAGSVCSDPVKGKEAAAAICAGKGYDIVGLSDDPKAGCTVTCCPPAPPPPPPPEACTWQALGDGTACIAYGDLKLKAVSVCEAQKAEVRSLYPADDCPNGATIAKLECCVPGSAPVPDPKEPPPPTK